MKAIISFLTITIGFALVTKAEVITLDCQTDKGTSLVLVYDNYSDVSHKAEIISISIAGKDMKSRLENGAFRTSGGRPSFGLTEFPQEGMTTRFDIYTQGTYIVYKNGSYSGESHNITCENKSSKTKGDSGF